MQQGPGRNRKATVWARESFVVYLLPSVCWHCGITYRIKTWPLLYEAMRIGLWDLSHRMGETEPCWVSEVLTLSFSGHTGFSSDNCKQQLWPSHLLKKRTWSVDIPNIGFPLNPPLDLDSFICCRLWCIASVISCFIYIRLITVILAINFFWPFLPH